MNQRETDGIRALTRGELDRVSGGELPSVRAGLEWVATRLGLEGPLHALEGAWDSLAGGLNSFFSGWESGSGRGPERPL